MIIIPNRFITKIEQAIGTVDIDALKEYVKSPTEFERKDDVPMMCMAEFWNDELGRAYYNFKSIDDEWLALDVDDNMKISDFMTQFSDYDYILYTSFNHTAEHHKFRVLLHYCGLDYSLLGANLDEIKSNWHFTLETMFPWADKNAMDMTRALAPNITKTIRQLTHEERKTLSIICQHLSIRSMATVIPTLLYTMQFVLVWHVMMTQRWRKFLGRRVMKDGQSLKFVQK